MPHGSKGKQAAPSNTFHHFRASSIALELDDAVDDFVQEGLFEQKDKEVIFEQFDQALAAALAEVDVGFKIFAKVDHYRSVDGVWNFMLDSIEVLMKSEVIRSKKKTKLLSAEPR